MASAANTAKKQSSKSGPSRDRKPAPRSQRKNPDVDAWFDHLEHPLKGLMLQVRRVVMASDLRVTESIKWSTPTFSYNGDIASFIPQAKSFVSLIFHRGSEIPGKHPRLEGDSRLARTMRFASVEELKKNKLHLEKAARAWCDYKST